MGEHFDILFDPSNQNFDEETLPLDEILFQAIQTKLLEMHVCLPCKVTKVNATTGYVNVQPTLQTRYKTKSAATNLPEIQSVPVQMPSGQDWWIKAPIAVGDVGVLLFSERSLDNWSVTSGQEFVDPNDSRMFNLSDAIFLPGIRTSVNPISGAGTDLVVHNGSATFSVQKAGKFKIANQANELISVLADLVADLITATTVLGGPFTPGTIAQLTAIEVKLLTLKGT